MKKFILAIVWLLLIFSIYYLYNNKNRLYYKYKHRNDPNGYVFNGDELVQPEPKPETKNTVLPESEIADSLRLISERYSKLEFLCNQNVDSIDVLNKIIDSLNTELASKPKIKIQSNPFDNSTTFSSNKNTNKNLKTKTLKNEKNTLIARGTDAIQLKEFFTKRYDNRR
jgi:hypothetical protein